MYYRLSFFNVWMSLTDPLSYITSEVLSDKVLEKPVEIELIKA